MGQGRELDGTIKVIGDNKSLSGRFIGVGIVRDKDGNPKFDDPNNVPQIVLNALTPEDLEHLNKLRNQ